MSEDGTAPKIPLLSRPRFEECRVETNSARVFRVDVARSARGSLVSCRELYSRYQEWCKAHGHKPVPDTQFGKEVFRTFPRVKRRKAAGGRHVRRPYNYVGLALMSP